MVSTHKTDVVHNTLGDPYCHIPLALLLLKGGSKQMTTFLIIAGIYLVIGIVLIAWAVHVDARTLWALPMFPVIILAWPYFLVRMWVDK
ncbi:hypothetical protein CPT_Moonbeam10 [Bacillus phage Moonbeam]|uniref:Uncharacterized protein n=1 Tax=Bacillus phage Moonbeam TaxID=1540091 RepID=A0A0A0RUY8_9CAUD|nr:hypothetical protein CPT_Moonbeam10 [Bacillus phage Moonbeam]AIW03408.1 hypothetical protein CPT_Moonbeam10 [Bacillus phage Moonbeam]